jgi:GAF domain-containing protein
VSSIDPDALASSLEHLASLDFGHDLETALDEVVRSLAGLFHVTGAGLMFVDSINVLRTVVASDEPGKVLESAQEQLGIGPCNDSLVHGTLVASEDVAADPRWPGLADLVVPHGVRAVLGAPIRLGGAPVGSLNAYCDLPHDWDDTEQEAIRRYAGLIENVIGAAVLAHQRGRLVDQLEFALEHRVIIERAIGLLMGRERLDAVAAFDKLRRLARSQRRKVAEIASEILEGKQEDPLG